MKIVKPKTSLESNLNQTYVCEISGWELLTLKIILFRIGGSPDTTLRSESQKILDAMPSCIKEIEKIISDSDLKLLDNRMYFQNGHKEVLKVLDKKNNEE